MNIKSLFVIVFFLYLLGCSEQVMLKDVPGNYTVLDGVPGNVLEIKSDGKYIHRYKTLSNSTMTVHDGVWEIETSENSIRIIFDNFSFAPVNGVLKPTGIWSTNVLKKNSSIILCFDPDISENKGCFRKVDDK